MSVNRVLLAFIYNALPLLTTATVHIHFLVCFIIIIAKLMDSIYVSVVRQTLYNINSVNTISNVITNVTDNRISNSLK